MIIIRRTRIRIKKILVMLADPLKRSIRAYANVAKDLCVIL